MYDNVLIQQLSDEYNVDKKLEKKYKAVAKSTYDSSFPKQQNVLKDKFDRIAVLTPRRAGKTRTAIHKLIITHCENPGAWTAIVAITQGSARRLYWKDLQDIAKKEGLDLVFDKHLLEVNWPCGGKIILIGADRWSEVDKLRGLKFHGVVLDEAKSYSPRILKELIEEVIEPALQDFDGWLLMIGTPGSILAGVFYEATCQEYKDGDGDKISKLYGSTSSYWKDKEPLWSFHHWTLRDNPYMASKFDAAYKRKQRKKWPDDHPVWVREYLGQWSASEDALVYPFSALRNKTDEHNEPLVLWRTRHNSTNVFGLPDATKDGHSLPSDSWKYLLGVDLGFNNPSGLVIAAYNEFLPNLYAVWDKKETKLSVSQLAEEVQAARDMLPDGQKFYVEVFDTSGSGGPAIMKELNTNFGCSFVAADKGRMRIRKMDYFHLVGDYMHMGRIKILPNSGLAQEMEMLQWNLDAGTKSILAEQGRLKEHPECPNHLSDAFLYLFKWWYKKQTPSEELKPPKLTVKEQENREIAKLLKKKDNFLRISSPPARILNKKSGVLRLLPLINRLKNEFLV